MRVRMTTKSKINIQNSSTVQLELLLAQAGLALTYDEGPAGLEPVKPARDATPLLRVILGTTSYRSSLALPLALHLVYYSTE